MVRLLFILIFLASAAILNAQPTVQDCAGAIPICQNTYSQANSFTGSGNITGEITNGFSCIPIELNDVWYTFTVQTSGNLSFLITPNVSTNDYDWVVYNLTNAQCSDIASNPNLDVSCNYSSTTGPTGPNGGSPFNSQLSGGTPFNALIPVLAGETYVINISNWSPLNQSGYTIDFSASSAQIFDNVKPSLLTQGQTLNCGDDSVVIQFSENVLCSSVQVTDFALNGPGGPYTVNSYYSSACSIGAVYDNTFTLYFSPPLSVTGTFYAFIVDSVYDNCTNVADFPDSLALTVNGIALGSSVNHVKCFGGNDGSIQVNASGGVTPYTFAWSPSVSVDSIASGLSAGTYTVTVSSPAGCPFVQSFVITQPTAISGTTDSTMAGCAASDGSATVTVNGGTPPYSYLWSPSGGTSSTASTIPAGNYSVVVTDSNLCTAAYNVQVVQGNDLGLISQVVQDVSCFGGNDGEASVTATLGSGNISAQWYSASGNPVNGNQLSAGSYYVVVTDTAGCIDTAFATITQPAAALSGTTDSTMAGCAAGDGSATVTVFGGTPPYSYLWSPVGGTSSTASNIPAGNYSVTVTDNNLCTATFSVQVLQGNDLGLVTQVVQNVSCFGGNDGEASVTAALGSGNISAQWFNSSGNPVNGNQLSAGNYYVVVTDTAGCIDTAFAIITGPSSPLSSLTAGLSTSCGLNNGTAGTLPSGGTAPYSYLWSTNVTSSAVSGLAAGMYYVTVTDFNGCTFIDSVNIASSTSPSSSLTLVNNVSCNGGSNGSAVISTATGTPPYSYFSAAGSFSNDTLLNLPAGTHQVITTDAGGCTDTSYITISEPLALTANVIVIPDTICIGDSSFLSVMPGGGTSPYSYLWSNGAASSAVFVSPAATALYSVLITDANGCTNLAAGIQVSVQPPLSLMPFSDQVICENETVNIAASVTGGDGNYFYTWNNMAGSNSISVSPAGDTIIVLIVDDGCSTPAVSDTFEIFVEENPVAVFSAFPVEGCTPIEVTFSDSSVTVSGSAYLWNFGDGSSSAAQHPVHSYTTAGIFSVSLQVTTPAGCSDFVTHQNLINALLQPVAQFSWSPQPATLYNPEIEFTDQSFGAASWLWSFGDGSSTSSLQHPAHTYSDTGSYLVTLIVHSDQQCVDTVSHYIQIMDEPAFYVPNSFSPNGDGKNDALLISGLGISAWEFILFNRWGEKIFESKNDYVLWNGFDHDTGDEMMQGMYVYLLEVEDALGKKHVKNGTVAVVR